MNIHPIFVHFPIALLAVYSILECIRFKKIQAHVAYKEIKAFLAIAGTVGAFLALSTGDTAVEAILGKPELRAVARVHENFADGTTFIYTVIAVSYLVILILGWFKDKPSYEAFVNGGLGKIWTVVVKISQYIQKTYIIIPLAVAGIVLVTITGALGGLMVYGIDVDPVITFIGHLFFPTM